MKPLLSNLNDGNEQEQTNKIKQRESLENAYGNLVEPYVKQVIEVPPPALATASVAFPCFCTASVWLLLTFWCCVRMRGRGVAASRRKKSAHKLSG